MRISVSRYYGSRWLVRLEEKLSEMTLADVKKDIAMYTEKE